MATRKIYPPIVPGQEFERWTVLSPAPPNKKGGKRWHCRCRCGTIRDVDDFSLKIGNSRSCGCLKVEVTTKRATKHGYVRHGTIPPEYTAWAAMKGRVFNKNGQDFPDYGGRGITVSEEYAHSFEAWLADIGPRPGPGYSIGRIDNNRGYEKGNVRWETATEQANNRRTSRLLTHEGVTKTATQWAKERGFNHCLLDDRLKRGWSVADALSISPVGRFHKKPKTDSPQ